MGGDSFKLLEKRVAELEHDADSERRCVADLERRVLQLEGLLTSEQHSQRRLIQQAEQVIAIAEAEGQL